jgi:hypothetical protein
VIGDTDTIYKLFARQLSGFEYKKAKTIYRDFIKNYTRIEIDAKRKTIDICLNKKNHLPLLMSLEWFNNGVVIPWLNDFKINYRVSNTT